MTELTGDSPVIKDCTTATFRTDVIAESSRQPVLVDFWAPWCGPCKQLTPILEKVVRAAGGKVKLVKMNIEGHPQIPGQLGVQSIPAVFAFQKGQPVDGFMGTLSESQIRAFLERLVGPIGHDFETELAEAEEALAVGDFLRATELFVKVMCVNPVEVRAIAGLVKTQIQLGDFAKAREALANVPPSFENHAALVNAKAALENAEQAAAVGDLADLERRIAGQPYQHQAHIDYAVALNARGRREDAAEALLKTVRVDRNWNEGAARKQLLQLFDAWGPADPDTLSARRKLSGILFS